MSLDSLYQTLVNFGATWGIRIVGVLVALFFAHIISAWAKRALTRSLERRNFDLTLTRFFGALIRYSILVGAVIGCLGVFGIQTASFAAAIAAIGLAIGLALQGTLSNFAAGIMLLVFTTGLKTLDNRKLVIPNSAIFGQVIENLTHHEIRRVDVPVGVTYSADIDETRKVLEQIPASIPEVLDDPPPQIFLGELGASSVDWQVRLWCSTDKYWDVHQAAVRNIKKALDEANLGIPFPQMDVHLDREVVSALGGRRGL
jgi:small conductance mechanosensitive channel